MKDEQPHFRTIWGLSFLFSPWIIGVLNLLLAVFYTVILDLWVMIAIFLLIMILMYFIYYKSGRGKEIVENIKPVLLGSQLYSTVFSILFTVVSVVLFIIVPIIIRPMLK